MASFVGTTVQLTLRSGAVFVGTIISIDTATSTLHVSRADTGETCAVQRSDLLDVSTVAAPAPVPPKEKKAAPSASATTESKKKSNGTPQRVASPAPGSTRSGTAKKERRKNGSRGDTPGPTAADAPPSFNEEFDFAKSAQSFDKKKIWEEIRSQEATPNANLLVNLNRNPLLSQSSRIPMLAPHEMVLDEAPEPVSASAPVSGAAAPPSAELESLRAQQRAMEQQLAEARAEAAELRSQLALSEALTGLHIDSLGDGAYRCGVYRDAKTSAAHWRHKYQDAEPAPPEGSLRYVMRAPGIGQTDRVSLGYGGPHKEHSDAEVLSKLPDHFLGDINIKLDNAQLFQRRLLDLMNGL